ncbi:4a-hydroxytetrahydrobiopterin dehydratase [Ottowia thiooxydans]|uniref:4a-hydroxytetrahydrobiopterin dehydratase n=1 Tax=Ottowia thiooxydans TaxID=219182 RepID=UPI003395800B
MNRPSLTADELSKALTTIDGWKLSSRVGGPCIEKSWRFADFHQTMAFVNAVAQIAHSLDHHPELQVSYGTCLVQYTTHDAGGLTHRDIDSALRVNALAEGRISA